MIASVFATGKLDRQVARHKKLGETIKATAGTTLHQLFEEKDKLTDKLIGVGKKIEYTKSVVSLMK